MYDGADAAHFGAGQLGRCELCRSQRRLEGMGIVVRTGFRSGRGWLGKPRPRVETWKCYHAPEGTSTLRRYCLYGYLSNAGKGSCDGP